MNLLGSVKVVCFAVFGLLLISCSSSSDPLEEEFIPSYLQLQTNTPTAHTGAIYQPGLTMGLYQDVKARRVGDILTVILVEETNGQNSMDNNVNSSTALNLDTPIFGGESRPDFNYGVGAESTFEGQSGSSQSNRLNGAITVTVHQVLPNGNLVVQGEKWIRINQANEYIKLEGVVRPIDIDPLNTLLSTQVADARISYAGKGTNNQGTTPGWVSKIIFSPLWPF